MRFLEVIDRKGCETYEAPDIAPELKKAKCFSLLPKVDKIFQVAKSWTGVRGEVWFSYSLVTNKKCLGTTQYLFNNITNSCPNSSSSSSLINSSVIYNSEI